MASLAALALVSAACGPEAEQDDTPPAAQDALAAEVPAIVVTTGIWADVVSNVACGGLASVETLIPVGGDPHSYEPSLQDRARMEAAALVVANGLMLEEALVDTLEAVAESGTPVFEFAEGMDIIPYSFESAHGHEAEDDDHAEDHDHAEDDDHTEDDHDDEDDHDADHAEDDHDADHAEDEDDHGDDHADDDHDEDGDDHGHGHGGGGDPHVWFDPHRVAEALPSLVRTLTTGVGLDPAAVEACLGRYLAELETVDAEIAGKVDQLPAENRKLVTNHEALGYFADRYGFEVIGTVIPTPASMAQASPAGLEELAEIIEHEGITAVFAETLHSVDDVEALAARVGDVDVVTLYTGSLGPPDSGAETYVGFLRTNADLIVDALG